MKEIKLSLKKQKAVKMTRQAKGTLCKIETMINEGIYCPEVIQQVDSVIGLLKSAKRELLAGHLDTCASKELTQNKNKAIEELLKIYNLSN